jgi:hypothetical protein
MKTLSMVGMVFCAVVGISDLMHGQYVWSALMIGAFLLNLYTYMSWRKRDPMA